MIKRILAGVCDPRYTSSLACYTSELAKRFDTDVTLISVTDMIRLAELGRVPLGVGNLVQEIVDERVAENEAAIQQSLDILVRRVNADDIPCTVIKSKSEPYDALANAARYQRPDDFWAARSHGTWCHGRAPRTR